MKAKSTTLCRISVTGTVEEIVSLLEWMGKNKIYCEFLMFCSDQYYDALFQPINGQRIMDHISKEKEVYGLLRFGI